MKAWLSQYSLRFPEAIAYMLQAVEYDWRAYLAWLRRVTDFRTVMHRRSLDTTMVARLFVWCMRTGILAQYAAAVWLMVTAQSSIVSVLSVAIGALAPFTWSVVIIIPMLLARRLIIIPRERHWQAETKQLLAAHSSIKIAVAGSYGKTTMKEILHTVLSEGKKVAATPANNNVAAAHYAFAKSLKGDEEVIVVEFGEGRPGDVADFSGTVQPDIGIITGLAPAHLDQYGTLDVAARDIFSLAEALGEKPVYVNGENEAMQPYLRNSFVSYSRRGVAGWKVSDAKSNIDGIQFTLSSGKRTLKLKSGLLGEHLVGVLSAAAVIALDLGLSEAQVEAGIAATEPYEHRMQPYLLAGGWVIDDAYNGNIEGVKAGTMLLSVLPAQRKIYVTPGLVDQGEETERVHLAMGRLIAQAKPDIVVLMKNSVTQYIEQGLEEANFVGELRIETNPLHFYTHLDQFLAVGDICMLQNDWTDNYA